MNELQTTQRQLPDTLPELAKFALVGREKLAAVRAEIRAIDKLNLANEVHEQKLIEAQDIAEAVLDAEVKIGELTAQIEKGSGGDHGNQHTGGKSCSAETFAKTKTDTLKDIGLSKFTAYRFEQLAKNPEKVKEAKEAARESGSIVTREAVEKKIKQSVDEALRPRNVVKEAQSRHREFMESKENGLVSIEDIKQDNADTRLLTIDLYMEICKAAGAFDKLILLKNEEGYGDLFKKMDRQAYGDLENRLSRCTRLITSIRRDLEKAREEGK